MVASPEVSLWRTLHCCESAAAADPAWLRTPAAAHAAEACASQAGALPLSCPARGALKAKADALVASLQPSPKPAYLRAPVPGGRAPPPPPAPPSELRKRAATAAAAAHRHAGVSAAEAALRAEAASQEALAAEMVGMAVGLKRNAVAMHEGVRASLRSLDAVDASIERNLGAARGAVAKATALHSANRASCWHTAGVVFLVCFVFVFMAAFILATRDRTRR